MLCALDLRVCRICREAIERRLIHHLFAGRLLAGNRKVKLLRESLNVAAAAQALKANGEADLVHPESEIFSVPAD